MTPSEIRRLAVDITIGPFRVEQEGVRFSVNFGNHGWVYEEKGMADAICRDLNEAWRHGFREGSGKNVHYHDYRTMGSAAKCGAYIMSNYFWMSQPSTDNLEKVSCPSCLARLSAREGK